MRRILFVAFLLISFVGATPLPHLEAEGSEWIEHKCIHDDLPKAETLAIVDEGSYALRQTPQPFRVVVNTDGLEDDIGLCHEAGEQVTLNTDDELYTCKPEDVLTPAKKNFLLNKVIPDVVDRLGTLLNVSRVVGNLPVPGPTCGCGGTQAAVSPEIQENGVPDADVVIFMTA